MSSHLDALRAHIHRMDIVSCMLTEAAPSREEMEAAAKRFGVDTPLYAVTHKMWNSDFSRGYLPGHNFGRGNPDLKAMETILWFHGDTRDTPTLGGEDHKFEGSRAHPNVGGPGFYFTSLLLEAVQYGTHITAARTNPGFRFLHLGGAHRFENDSRHHPSWKELADALEQEFPGVMKTRTRRSMFRDVMHDLWSRHASFTKTAKTVVTPNDPELYSRRAEAVLLEYNRVVGIWKDVEDLPTVPDADWARFTEEGTGEGGDVLQACKTRDAAFDPGAEFALKRATHNTGTRMVYISPLQAIYSEMFQGNAAKYLAFMARHWDGFIDIGMNGCSTHLVLFNLSAVEMSRVPEDLAAKSAETFAALQYHNKNKQGPKRVSDFLTAGAEVKERILNAHPGSTERAAAEWEHEQKFGREARKAIWKAYGLDDEPAK